MKEGPWGPFILYKRAQLGPAQVISIKKGPAGPSFFVQYWKVGLPAHYFFEKKQTFFFNKGGPRTAHWCLQQALFLFKKKQNSSPPGPAGPFC